MKCVVTGAAGFIGSSITDRLLKEGHEVVGIDCFIDYYPKEQKLKNLQEALAHERFTFISENLLTLDLVAVLRGAEIIFHQAAQAGVRASWGDDFAIYTNNNILATQRLLEAAKDSTVKSGLRKIVYASSSSVYGNAEMLPTTEDLRPQPLSPYGVSKLAAEHLMVLYSEEFGVPTTSLRYFTVYGPRQRPDMGFHRFLRAALTQQEILIYGDGEQSRDFTFISDIVEANLQSALSPGSGLVLNIGGGSRVTVNQILEEISSIVGQRPAIKYIETQKGDVRHTGADTSKARAAIGYTPKVNLATGLRHEAQWLEGILR